MSPRRISWLGALLLGVVATAQATETVVYYHTDALHSTTVVTNAQGQVIERTHYAPYGAVLNRALRDGPGYAGHEEDAATGLVYMQQRYYDPESGTFLSTDPVEANPGAGFNRYAYANDNPYRYTDPDGRCVDGVTCDPMVRSYAADELEHPNRPLTPVDNLILAIGATAATFTGVDEVAAFGGFLRSAGSFLDRKAVTEELGVVYKRINPHTLEEYVGKAKSWGRYLARQGEHDRTLGVKHEYEVLGRTEPGKALSHLEETEIRANGGLQREGGTLANKIHAMSRKNYEGFQGVYRVEGRIDSINLAKKLDGG